MSESVVHNQYLGNGQMQNSGFEWYVNASGAWIKKSRSKRDFYARQ
jgi:hypothetical protein